VFDGVTKVDEYVFGSVLHANPDQDVFVFILQLWQEVHIVSQTLLHIGLTVLRQLDQSLVDV